MQKPTPIKRQSPRTWLIPAIFAAILFLGGVAGNLVAAYVQPNLEPYRLWVSVIFVLAFFVAVAFAIREARRTPDASTSSGNSSSKLEGDVVSRDKITHVYQTAAPAVATALHQLRAPVGDFVGREPEIETLINSLRSDGRAGITGISGMGGIGKTELALFVAERVASEYPDAQFFVNLQGADPNPRRTEEALATFIRAFVGLEAALPDDLDQLTQLYLSQLSGKRVLVVLDNAADSAQVRPLLPPKSCAALVTSRHTLTLPGMTALTLNPLTAPEARQMLLEIAPRTEPVADKVCYLCGYLPLAIRAAGSLLVLTVDLDPADYAEQLSDERTRLERLGTEGVEIGVEASFNLSYARLDSETARVFRQLAVFPATFDAAAEEVVCADPGHVRLSDLVRRSLVLYDSVTKRYRLHDLERLFAGARASYDEGVLAQKRHSMHYQTVLAAAEVRYLTGGESVGHGLALFDLEWANIQAGQAWAEAGAATDQDAAILCSNYANAGVYVLDLRQHPRKRIRWFEAALAAAKRMKDRACEGNAVGNLGNAYAALGETRRAIEFYEQALLIGREIADLHGESNALGSLGLAYANLGETRRAIEFYEQALVIDRKIGDHRGEAADLSNLGNAHAVLKEPRRAIEFYEQGLVIVRALGDRRGEGNALGNLGVAHKNLGELPRAIKFYEQSLLIVREIGDRGGESNVLGNLGTAYLILGDVRRAIEFYAQQLEIAREIGDRHGQGLALFNLSLPLAHLDDRNRALACAKEALAILEQIEDPNAAHVRAQLAKWRASPE